MRPELLGSSFGVDGRLYRLTFAIHEANAAAFHDFLTQEGFSANLVDPIDGISFIQIACDQSKPFADGQKEIDSIKERFCRHFAQL